ncbi:type IV toxin-antitoxin system AbiEi family antitoxin [Nocardia sp. BMG51109]|uniref:type IV toxin-antitoxin system AbiEi family antitoxin domain-containing protein n=1 Tax=Nocardia sp. BMG51109 TaxID=1056816 RepID=UPI0004AFCC3A|nr:type IV toxin-antitoxin system AbiEi family antitoxin [Nocardia sp. BMG51109]
MIERNSVGHASRQAGIRPELARLPLRTLTPSDAADIYRHPRQQLAKLTARGLLHRPAYGYYIVVPQDRVDQSWQPELEAVAAGIATAAFDPDHAILMGASAARVHGAIPRALAVAVVAVPKQRAPLQLIDRAAIVRFVTRDTDRLDAELIGTTLGPTLVTTPEQTVLDLAHRPELGDADTEVPTAIRTLYRRCDPGRLAELATHQRLRAALDRATAITESP